MFFTLAISGVASSCDSKALNLSIACFKSVHAFMRSLRLLSFSSTSFCRESIVSSLFGVCFLSFCHSSKHKPAIHNCMTWPSNKLLALGVKALFCCVRKCLSRCRKIYEISTQYFLSLFIKFEWASLTHQRTAWQDQEDIT